MISSLHEIYLITNRLFILKNRNHWVVNIRFIYYIPFLIIIPLAAVIPFSFMFSINKSEKNSELYYWFFSDTIKNSFGFRAYFLVLIFIENILPTIFLLILSILCHKQYTKRIQIKSKITIHAINDLKKLENGYTRITIILTVLFIITRFSDFLIGISIRAIVILNLKIEKMEVSLLNFIRQFTFLLYFGLFSFNGLLYIQIDNNLKALAKKKFVFIKVIFVIHFK